MSTVQTRIREIAKRLLSEGRVDVVIGYQEGSMPKRMRPAFIRNADDADRLVWNQHCEPNLANYLPRLAHQRVAIVAKGCDSRSVVTSIQEGVIAREAVYVIGVPCEGLIEPGEANRQESLYETCAACRHRNPVLFDEMAGEAVSEEPETDEFAAVNAFEAKSPEERWEAFVEESSKCIRCYACRNACPLCACEHCFTDNTKPRWIPGGVRSSDVQVFLITRALHAAGRCVDCGACERACPMGVRLRLLNKKMEKSVRDRFDHEPGADMDGKPPLAVYSEDDAEDFMTH